MSRKSKGKVPKSNEEDINRKHKDVNPNAQYTGESTEVDAEQERRKRKDGKGYAKTTPTDPVERTKFYKKRDNQREASKKFRANQKTKLSKAEQCRKEYDELKADYEKLLNAYTNITSKIDNIRRHLNSTNSTIPNGERELMLSILQYTPLTNSPRSNESSEGSESTGESSCEDESDENVNQIRSQSESTTSMDLLSLNPHPQHLQQFVSSHSNQSGYSPSENADQQQYRNQANQSRSSHQTMPGTLPYANWNEQPQLPQQQYGATYSSADVNQIDPAISYSNGNSQQFPQQQQYFNTIVQFGDSTVEISMDSPYSHQHELQRFGSSQPANSGVMGTTPSYQQSPPQNRNWQQGPIPPQPMMGSVSSSQAQYANPVPIEPGLTPMHQPVLQYGTVTRADYAPAQLTTHFSKDHSYTEPYEPNGNPLTVPRAPRPNSFMVNELQDRTCPENNRRVTKANRRYSTYVPPQELPNANDVPRPVNATEKDSPYAKKPSRDS